MQLNLNDMLQSYGLDSEYPETWKDSRYSSALATLDGSNVTESGALVDELLSAITTNPTVASDEQDPLGTGSTIMQLLKNSHSHVPRTSAQRGLYMPSSTTFDPRKFLNDVHSQSSLADLQRGLDQLKQKMEWNESGLRQMVDTDYENYVATKRKLDDVMDQLHHIGVRKDTEYGFEELENKMDNATNQLTLCARPMDGFNIEKQRLENALKSIETHRKIMELPQTLAKHYHAGEHGQFVREYKRGVRMLEKMTQSQSLEEQKLGSLIAERSQHVLHLYREHVHKKLLHTSADGPYAPLLAKLMDLGVAGNPAMEWLNHNIQRFSSEIEGAFNELLTTVSRNATDSMESERKLDLVTYLRHLPVKSKNITEVSDYLEALEHTDTEEAIGQWEQLLAIFANLRTILSRASVFYREFLSLTANSGGGATTQFSQQDIDVMTHQCHKLVTLTSTKLVESISRPVTKPMLPIETEHHASAIQAEDLTCTIIPVNSNSLAVAKYLGRILELLNAANDQISNLFSGSASNPLSQGITVVKQQFVKSLCECWTRDSMKLGGIQDWVSGATSNFPQYFYLYHGLIIEKLRFLLDVNRGGPASADTVNHITSVFPAALALSVRSVEAALVESSQINKADAAAAAIEAKLQPSTLNQDSKLLVTLNNLEMLRESSLEEIYDQFETVINQQKHTRGIRKEVGFEVNKIATQLFEIYIRKKKAKLSQVLHQEIQRLIPLWRDDNLEVKRVSNYIYECLMILVETHALFMESCPQLIRRAILDLYSHMLTNISEILRREVEVLSRYGTLQNVADLEFTRWAMSQLPETKDLCRRIFDDIKQASTDEEVWRSPKGARSYVMDMLDQSIRNSQLAFLCFKSLGESA